MRRFLMCCAIAAALAASPAAGGRPAPPARAGAPAGAVDWRPRPKPTPPGTLYFITFKPKVHQSLCRLMDRYPYPRRHPQAAAEIREAIYINSLIHGLDPLRVGVQIARESDFYPRAKSPCGARGLMQIMPFHYSGLGITDPYDIWQSVNGGCRLMAGYLREHGGDHEKAWAHYNGGRGGVPLSSRKAETRHYVRWIAAEYAALTGGRPAAPPAPEEARAGVYVVRAGDTLWRIARRFGTTVERLAEINNIKDPNLIRTGWELKI